MHILSEQIRQEHILSGVDARLKLLVSAALLLLVLSHKGFGFPLVVLAMGLLLCIMMRVSLRVFVLRFSEPVFIACMLVLIKLFFSGRDVLFTFPVFGLEITGYRDGLIEGLLIAVRIIGAVSVIAVLGFTTSFTDMISGLAWFRFPKTLIEILLFAYRYIFMLLEDAMVIYNAQKNRLGYSSIRRGMKSFGVLAGSLILKAFEHSQKATVAMVQRGYDGTMPMLQHKAFKPSEIAVSVVIVVMMGVLWKM
jgi:cobalt/nickel transport system permease protein